MFLQPVVARAPDSVDWMGDTVDGMYLDGIGIVGPDVKSGAVAWNGRRAVVSDRGLVPHGGRGALDSAGSLGRCARNRYCYEYKKCVKK